MFSKRKVAFGSLLSKCSALGAPCCWETSTLPPSTFWHQALELLQGPILTSLSFSVKFLPVCFGWATSWMMSWYRWRDTLPLCPESSQSCLLHDQHIPCGRGWRGRAGCPGWMVRRPWRCKDRRCCCCSCCICKSCCWKANCWVATCCCCKRMRQLIPKEG